MERDKITPLEKSIGEKIGKLRVNNGGETQETLATSIGVSREIIQHWERGTRRIKADHIKSLAEHFNVSSDYLLGLSPGEKPEYHEFAKITHFQPLTISQLYSLSVHGRDGFPYDGQRLSFELFINSIYFSELLEILREYLEMSKPSKTGINNEMYILLDKEVTKLSDGNLHVVSSGLMASTFLAKAQKTLSNLFEGILKDVAANDGWEYFLPPEGGKEHATQE